MRSKVTLAAVLVTALFLGAGCGGSSDDDKADTDAITTLIDDVNRVTEEKDAEGFCALMQPSGIEPVFHTKARCAEETEAILKQAGKQPPIEIEEINVEGDTATVDLTGKSGQVTVVKEDGDWYVPLSSDQANPEATDE